MTPIISVNQAAVFRALSDGAGAAEVFVQAALCPVLQLHLGDSAVCHGEAPCYAASSTDVASSEVAQITSQCTDMLSASSKFVFPMNILVYLFPT